MLELAVLGLLQEQPLHGYELKKRLGDMLGSLWGVSFGSLYPALRRLERDGAIEVVEAPTAEHPAGYGPSTGSLAGDLAAARSRRRPLPSRRARKAYRITEHGQALFVRLLAVTDDAGDDRAFTLRLAFGRYLDPTDRIALLERRRALLTERLTKARRSDGGALDRYVRALADHRTRAIETDLQWVGELIAEERARLAERPEGATA